MTPTDMNWAMLADALAVAVIAIIAVALYTGTRQSR